MIRIDELRGSRAIQEAIAIGRQEGILEGKLEAVAILLQQGLSVEAIASALSLPKDQVERVAETNA